MSFGGAGCGRQLRGSLAPTYRESRVGEKMTTDSDSGFRRSWFVMKMRERKAAVLAKLYEHYRTYGGDSWSVVGESIDEELGLARGDFDMIVRALADQGFVDSESGGLEARLTADGVEAIEEPGTEENRMVQERTSIVQHVSVSGGHVQIGDGNTQNFTYQMALTALAEAIERDPQIPAADKSKLRAAIGTVLGHPLTQTVLGAAAAAGTAYAIK